jgi:hypothetical protein
MRINFKLEDTIYNCNSWKAAMDETRNDCTHREHPHTADVLAYIADMADELASLARQSGAPGLADLLELACREAHRRMPTTVPVAEDRKAG